ncbi:MAG: phage late control D family protein [Sphingomonas fennica]
MAEQRNSGSSGPRLLEITALASETIGDYELVRFQGREAISEPFEYHLDLVARQTPATLGAWIGKLVEFTVAWRDRPPRAFAGRIYEARIAAAGGDLPTISLTVRPAYWATSYARGTHFIQDRTTIEIFDAITGTVPGIVADKAASGLATRPYAVRYDESELAFLDRLMAQDGVMYFFLYDRNAGAFRHRMKIANAASAYQDVPGDLTLSFLAGGGADVANLANQYRATAGSRRYHSFEVNKLDQPLKDAATVSKAWGSVTPHSHEELSGAALTAGQSAARGTAHTAAVEQGMEVVGGGSDRTELFAGGKIGLAWAEGAAPRRVVLTAVEHLAVDPPRLSGSGGGGTYSNSFTAIDAALPFRPPRPVRAPPRLWPRAGHGEERCRRGGRDRGRQPVARAGAGGAGAGGRRQQALRAVRLAAGAAAMGARHARRAIPAADRHAGDGGFPLRRSRPAVRGGQLLHPQRRLPVRSRRQGDADRLAIEDRQERQDHPGIPVRGQARRGGDLALHGAGLSPHGRS